MTLKVFPTPVSTPPSQQTTTNLVSRLKQSPNNYVSCVTPRRMAGQTYSDSLVIRILFLRQLTRLSYRRNGVSSTR